MEGTSRFDKNHKEKCDHFYKLQEKELKVEHEILRILLFFADI